MRVRSERDLRIDFFRGLALVIIFVDHVPGNWFARLTPVNFGFSNAADIFVLLAGISAAHAYFPLVAAHGYGAVLAKLLRRIAQLYCAHVAVLWLSIAVLAAAIHVFGRAEFMGHEIPASLPTDLGSAAWASMTLTLQPKYLDILPLYVVLLLLAAPLIFLERHRRGLGLAVSIVLWLATESTGFNLPSSRSAAGWYFNPFAWQVLFCIGLAAGIAYLQGSMLPRSRWGIAAAVGYILLAFVAASPCHFPSLGRFCHLSAPDEQVTRLTLWRIGHILALAYLAAALIPTAARWLSRPAAQLLALLGRNSLPVFLAGVIMSLLGSIMLAEFGGGWQRQILLNGIGGSLLLLVAAWSDRRRASPHAGTPRDARIRMRVALGQAAVILLLLSLLVGYALLPGSAVAHSILAIVFPAANLPGH